MDVSVITAQYIEKKSKFFGFCFSCDNIKDFEEVMLNLKKQEKKATHFVFAYTFTNPLTEKFSDDGEPCGTAGKPILEVIKKNQLQNFAIIVVRYFGGIKLGAGNLTRAYIKTASACIKEYINLK